MTRRSDRFVKAGASRGTAEDYGHFSAILWSICGELTMVLETNHDAGPVRAAMRLPASTNHRPLFEGTCTRDGEAIGEGFVGTLVEAGGKPTLAAATA